MKNLVFAFALLCSTILVAQFSYHVDENGVSGTGIQSPTNTASGVYSIAMGSSAQANGGYSTVIGTQSVATDIGSIAIGGGVNSDGLYSVGLGSSIAASGDYSMAMGYETQASGYSSTAMGNGTTANGDYSTAMGIGTQASGDYSTTMGNETIASGNTSTAMGNNTTASGSTSTALGYQTNASGNQSIAIGWRTNSNGAVSTAIGAATNAEDYISFAIGTYNKTDETPNPDSFSFENTAFVIGNGGFNSNGGFIGTDESRSNAFEVLFDGTTTIAGDLNINSDARLKANIISLGATLSKLLQIDGKTYTLKKDTNHKKKIGLLAQDIEKVFPELVTETNDIKSVNYQGLVPVLINALKEQDAKMKEQQIKYIEQEKRLERLEKLVANMD